MFDNGIRDFDDKTVYPFVVSRPKKKTRRVILKHITIVGHLGNDDRGGHGSTGTK